MSTLWHAYGRAVSKVRAPNFRAPVRPKGDSRRYYNRRTDYITTPPMARQEKFPRPERNLPGATDATHHEKEGDVEPGTPTRAGWFERIRGTAEEREVTDSSGRVVGMEIVRRVADNARETTIEVQHVVDGELKAISRTVADKKSGAARSYERLTPNGIVLREVVVEGKRTTDTEYRYRDIKTDTLPERTITNEYTDGRKMADSETVLTYDGSGRPTREEKFRLPTQPEDWIGTRGERERQVRRYDTTTQKSYAGEGLDSATITSETKGFASTVGPPERGPDDRQEVGILEEKRRTEDGKLLHDERKEIAVEYKLISTPGPGGRRNERIERTQVVQDHKIKKWERDESGRPTRFELTQRYLTSAYTEVVDFTRGADGRLLSETLTRNGEDHSTTTYEYKGKEKEPPFKRVVDDKTGDVKRYRRLSPEESAKVDFREDPMWKEVT